MCIKKSLLKRERTLSVSNFSMFIIATITVISCTSSNDDPEFPIFVHRFEKYAVPSSPNVILYSTPSCEDWLASVQREDGWNEFVWTYMDVTMNEKNNNYGKSNNWIKSHRTPCQADGNIMPILGEEGEFYKVIWGCSNIGTSSSEVGYVKKECVDVITENDFEDYPADIEYDGSKLIISGSEYDCDLRLCVGKIFLNKFAVIGYREFAGYQVIEEKDETGNNYSVAEYNNNSSEDTWRLKITYEDGRLSDSTIFSYLTHFNENKRIEKSILYCTNGIVSVKYKGNYYSYHFGLEDFQFAYYDTESSF